MTATGYQHIQVTPLEPLGAEIQGVDLTSTLSQEAVQEIRTAWLSHKVLFFRDQLMSPGQLAAFGACFGDLDTYPFVDAVEDHPHVIPIVKEPNDTLNFGGGWHTDTSYLAQPPTATLLHAVEVPDSGGDTLFADCSAAFEDLSAAMQQTLISKRGIYSPAMVHGAHGVYRGVAAQTDDSSVVDATLAASEVEHPIIRKHDETGCLSIYCTRFHTHRIKGWSRQESEPLIGWLNDFATRDKYVVRFKWQVGSLAMWDNRCVFHNPLNDYLGQRRHMHRVIVKGDVPRQP